MSWAKQSAFESVKSALLEYVNSLDRLDDARLTRALECILELDAEYPDNHDTQLLQEFVEMLQERSK